MKKVFIIHGFSSKPNGGWRPWLMDELGKQDVYACALPMPDPATPIADDWIEEISRNVDRNNRDQIYLVGHSLGVPAILRFLENTKAKNIKGVVLASGPIFAAKKKKIVQGGFLNEPFNFKAIRSKAKSFVVIHGDNDRNVSFDQGEALSKELNCKLIVIKNGGHLNGSSGWAQLPHALEALNEMFTA